MYNYIVISSCLFGSVYIFSKSLNLINELFLLENTKIPHTLILMNSLTFVISGSIFIYSITTNQKEK
jgi:hypothetical protein